MISVYLRSNFSGERRKTSISKRGTFPPFKVIQGHWYWCQSKAHNDFLLVRNSNLGPILHRFGDFAAFMCFWPHHIQP